MRIGVVGVGAVGGLLAARLVEAGEDVVGLARGATLAALRERGLVVRSGTGHEAAERVVPLEADDDPARIGPVDLLVVALKGPALAAGAEALAPMAGPDTVVLPAMNGVPWWFLPEPLASVDPTGTIGRTLPVERTIGCVVHFSASLDAPAVVRHGSGDRLIVGAARGGATETTRKAAASVAGALGRAGFAVEVSPDVRRDIWYKLWGNMTMNPVSALTGATGDRILADDLVRGFMVGAMAEAAAVGAAIGCPIEESGEERLDLARLLGPFRTSMLQDAEAGRPLELDALTGAVREIGLRVGVPTPSVDALHGLTRLMAATRGLT